MGTFLAVPKPSVIPVLERATPLGIAPSTLLDGCTIPLKLKRSRGHIPSDAGSIPLPEVKRLT